MRSEQFIDSVRDTGWKNLNDAQHTNIKKMWEKLFPSVASAELEIEDLQQQLTEANRQLAESDADRNNLQELCDSQAVKLGNADSRRKEAFEAGYFAGCGDQGWYDQHGDDGELLEGSACRAEMLKHFSDCATATSKRGGE